MPHRPLEHRDIDALKKVNDEVLLWLALLHLEPKSAEHRRNAERHQQGSKHRESNRIREWLKELALDALQREDRQKYRDDDQDRKEHRPPDLLRGDEYRLSHRVLAMFLEVS